jgi:hypothetical protein
MWRKSLKYGRLTSNRMFAIFLRLSENAHLLRYPHPSSLQRTSMYVSFLGISSRRKVCGMDIFHQPQKDPFFRLSQWKL